MLNKLKDSPIFRDRLIFIATLSNILSVLYLLEIIGSDKMELYNKIIVIIANILIQIGIIRTPKVSNNKKKIDR